MNVIFLVLFFAVLITSSFVGESFAEKKIKLHSDDVISVENLKFTLVTVDDSRCPSDITCVWQGQVTITTIIENQTNSKTVDFMPNDSFEFFHPYKITLLDVSPYPVSTKIPDDHIITFGISRNDGMPPCEKNMTIKDGLCFPESSTSSDFRDNWDSVVALYGYSGIAFVGIVLGFFIIKKLRDRN